MKEAAAIIIDCLPNMNTGQVTNRTVPLVKYLRAHGHAKTPIVLVQTQNGCCSPLSLVAILL